LKEYLVKISDIDVYRDDRTYSAPLGSVELLQNGDLLVVFREAVRRKRWTHIDRTSKAVLVRSSDGGRTWDPKSRMVVYEDECGIQDPAVRQLRDGTLIANFFKWRVGSEEMLPEDAVWRAYSFGGERYAWTDGTYVVRSFDGGYTWEKEATEVESPIDETVTSDPIVELPSGELLIPLYARNRGESERSFVMRSSDKGKTWDGMSTVGFDPFGNLDFDEPSLLYLPSGSLICMMRVHARFESEYGNYLYQSESKDLGRTWTTPRKTNIWGHPPHLLLLKSGRLLCAYGYRRIPYGVRVCLSHDGGKNWDVQNELVLYAEGAGIDLGYPSSAQLDDGTIFTAWYIGGISGYSPSSYIKGAFYKEK